MKTRIRALLYVLTSTLLVSCTFQIPVSQSVPENNKTYKVEYLFEYDGCKVYRFRDNGNFVYFTNCKGEITSIKSDSTEVRTTNNIKNDIIK